MQTITTAINSYLTTINTLELSPADANHCDQQFIKYYHYMTHIVKLQSFVTTENEDYAAAHDEKTIHKYQSHQLNKCLDFFEYAIVSANEGLIYDIETYFQTTYSLTFKSYNTYKKGQLTKPFTSYEPIINNLIMQVGSNFTESGKDQIREKFQQKFYKSNLPIRKGNKISLPEFVWLDSHYGSYVSLDYERNTGFYYMLDAVALCFLNLTERPQSFSDLYDFLKREIDFSQQYELCPAVSIRLYKNRRLDMVFANEATARKFWHYYDMQTLPINKEQ